MLENMLTYQWSSHAHDGYLVFIRKNNRTGSEYFLLNVNDEFIWVINKLQKMLSDINFDLLKLRKMNFNLQNYLAD